MDDEINTKHLIYYKTIKNRCPYDEWLNTLDNKTKSIIENRLERIRDGLYGNHRRLANSELSELKIDLAKGYRIYYKDLSNIIIIIIAGSDKGSQKRVIKLAEGYLKDFIERNKK